MARFDKVAFRDGVLQGDQWRFDNAIVVAARYDGLSDSFFVELDTIRIWVYSSCKLPIITRIFHVKCLENSSI